MQSGKPGVCAHAGHSGGQCASQTGLCGCWCSLSGLQGNLVTSHRPTDLNWQWAETYQLLKFMHLHFLSFVVSCGWFRPHGMTERVCNSLRLSQDAFALRSFSNSLHILYTVSILIWMWWWISLFFVDKAASPIYALPAHEETFGTRCGEKHSSTHRPPKNPG